MVEKGGYAVKVEQVKKAIVTLADLKPTEPQDQQAENYSRSACRTRTKMPTARSSAARGGADAEGQAGPVLASVIVGSQSTAPSEVSRKAGEWSWLGAGQLEIPGETLGWIDRQIMNVARERARAACSPSPTARPYGLASPGRDVHPAEHPRRARADHRLAGSRRSA